MELLLAFLDRQRIRYLALPVQNTDNATIQRTLLQYITSLENLVVRQLVKSEGVFYFKGLLPQRANRTLLSKDELA